MTTMANLPSTQVVQELLCKSKCFELGESKYMAGKKSIERDEEAKRKSPVEQLKGHGSFHQCATMIHSYPGSASR